MIRFLTKNMKSAFAVLMIGCLIGGSAISSLAAGPADGVTTTSGTASSPVVSNDLTTTTGIVDATSQANNIPATAAATPPVGSALAVPPVYVDENSEKAALLAATKTAQKTDQIILVVDHELSLWNKQADNTWKIDMKTYSGYGRNGLIPAEQRKEGDGTTPSGSFPILFAFGQVANPGASMTYRRITPNSYWSDEKATYNTWVESSTPVDGEHLSHYQICYKYAMAIGFNIDPVVYKRGSAIFLHIKDPANWSSSGCLSVEENYMLDLIKKCHDGVYIIISPDTASITNY